MTTIKNFALNAVGEKAVSYLENKYDTRSVANYLIFYWSVNNFKNGFFGKLPGLEDSICHVNRNLNGTYDGYLKIDDIEVDLKDNSILDIVSTIAVCLDLEDSDLKVLQPEAARLINSLVLGHKQKFNTNEYVLKFNKSDILKKCNVCQNSLFKYNKFVGCWCFEAEGTRSYDKGDFVTVHFDKAIWEREEVSVLLQTLKGQ